MHFPDKTDELIKKYKSKKEKHKLLKNINLDLVNFEIKLGDLGFSKKLKQKNELTETHVGTPLFMAP